MQTKTVGERAFKGWQIHWNLEWKKLCRSKTCVYVEKNAKKSLSGKVVFYLLLNSLIIFSIEQIKTYSLDGASF